MSIQPGRRRFLFSSALLGLGGVCPIHAPRNVMQEEEVQKPDSFHHFQLGLAAYSFRKQFRYSKGKAQKLADPKHPLDMFKFLEYCARHDVAGAELTSYFFPPDAERDYFRRIKRHAFKNGVTICGTAIGNNFSMGPGERLEREIAIAKSWIDKATEFGAPHIRFFAGTAKDLAKNPENLKFALDALQRCVDYAGKRGVFVGVENHGQVTADQMIRIINGVESPWFGVNLDTGNFQSEDPYRDLERIAPFAINVQVKVKMKDLEGNQYDADLRRVIRILKAASYKGFVVLEYEEADPDREVPMWLEKLREQMRAN